MGLFGKKKSGNAGRPGSMYSTHSTAPLTPGSMKSNFSQFSKMSVLEEKDQVCDIPSFVPQSKNPIFQQ
jgi:hypothetical protein